MSNTFYSRWMNFHRLPSFLYAFLISIGSVCAQSGDLRNQSLSVMPSAYLDDNHVKVGKGLQLSYERKVWKNLFVKGSAEFCSAQRLVGGSRSSFTNIVATGTDEYGNYFRGRRLDGSDWNSFIQNLSLLHLGVNYRFGKRNAFVPEVGLSFGSGYFARMKIIGYSWNNDTIVNASSSSSISRNRLSGMHFSLSYSFQLKNHFTIQPTFRWCLLEPLGIDKIGYNNNAGDVSANMIAFGLSIRKVLPGKKPK
jgi:hypothetical protein